MTVKTPAPGDLDPIERASRDEIAALQLERLRDTLARVYANVPHYRRAFDERGVHPDDLRTLADLAKFPFTTKAALRENYPFGMFAVPREEVVRVHASSGTTGKPTVVGYTQQDVDQWASLVARSLRAAGVRRGDMVHVAYGYGLFTGGLGAHYGAERLGCTVVPMSGGQTEKQVQLIRDFRPDAIMVTPSWASASMTLSTSPMSSGSRALVGSSKSSTFGSMHSARAMAARCFCPPDSRAGYSSRLSRSPTVSR